jgi:hypothetical protein
MAKVRAHEKSSRLWINWHVGTKLARRLEVGAYAIKKNCPLVTLVTLFSSEIRPPLERLLRASTATAFVCCTCWKVR